MAVHTLAKNYSIVSCHVSVRHKYREGHYVIGLSVGGINLVRSVTERLSETDVSIHVNMSQLLDVGSAVGADKVRQCRRNLLQLINDHSLVCQLTHLHLITSSQHKNIQLSSARKRHMYQHQSRRVK